MGELRFVYNGTLPEEAADKIVEYVLDALAVVDDAAVAFHDKTINKSIEVGDEVRSTVTGHFGMKGVVIRIDNGEHLPSVVDFGEGILYFYDETELEKVNDDA